MFIWQTSTPSRNIKTKSQKVKVQHRLFRRKRPTKIEAILFCYPQYLTYLMQSIVNIQN